MSLKVQCDRCSMSFSVGAGSAGKRVCCPKCDHPISVPGEVKEHVQTLETAGPASLERDERDDDFRPHSKRSRKHDHHADVGKFVRGLENRARDDAEQQPYSRNTSSVGMVLGAFLLVAGAVMMGVSFARGGGYGMALFIFGILLPIIFMLVGLMILLFSKWSNS